MKRKLLSFFIFLFSTQAVNSSIVYTFNGTNIIESICQDGKANHHIESEEGLIFKLEGNGEEKYEYPILHKGIHNTSTDGVKKFICTTKELDETNSTLYIEIMKRKNRERKR